jgi:hypothetical protein
MFGVSSGGGTTPATGMVAGDGAPGAVPDAAEGLHPSTLEDITGLPTGDYTWDDGGVNADRLATNELRFLMRTYGRNDAAVRASFAIVKVESVQSFTEDGEILTEKETGESFTTDGRAGQIAECGVLYDVLGDGIEMPLKIKQYLYGGCTSDEETNLLRVGGVYVLPLSKFVQDEAWGIYGDLDCLFEVDDEGLIHSHSMWEALNKYDGKPLETLWSDIEYLSEHPVLCSQFAECIGYGFVLESTGDTLKLVQPLVGWDDSDLSSYSAKLDADGKIVIETDGFNVFRPFEGQTLDDVNAAIAQIEQYIAG